MDGGTRKIKRGCKVASIVESNNRKEVVKNNKREDPEET